MELTQRRVIFNAMLDLKVIGICADGILYHVIRHLREPQLGRSCGALFFVRGSIISLIWSIARVTKTQTDSWQKIDY